MVFDAKFQSLFHLPEDLEHDMLSIDAGRLSDVRKLEPSEEPRTA
jgi:hypothetical protein